MSKDFNQPIKPPKKFKLGHLGNLNQVIKALGQTLRAMASGELDGQLGARLCSGLGILRSAMETQQLQIIEQKLDELQSAAAQGGFYGHRQMARTRGLSSTIWGIARSRAQCATRL
jgi:hypothetical protein